MSDLLMQAECMSLLQAKGPQSVFVVAQAYADYTGKAASAQAVWDAMDALEERGLVRCTFEGERVYHVVEGLHAPLPSGLYPLTDGKEGK